MEKLDSWPWFDKEEIVFFHKETTPALGLLPVENGELWHHRLCSLFVHLTGG